MRTVSRTQQPIYRRSATLCLTLALLFCAGLAALAPTPVCADNPVLRFEPDWTDLGIDEETEIALMLDNVDGLYGIEIQMTFNPTVVEILDMDDGQTGTQAQPGDYPYPDFPVKNEVRNSSGTVWYAVTQIAPREPLSGSGRVMTLRVRGRFGGDCPLVIHFAQLVNRDAAEMPVDIFGGHIAVHGEPTVIPPATDVPTIPAQPTQAPTRTPRPPTLVASDATAVPTETPHPAPTDTPPESYPASQATPEPPPTTQPGDDYPLPGDAQPTARPAAEETPPVEPPPTANPAYAGPDAAAPTQPVAQPTQATEPAAAQQPTAAAPGEKPAAAATLAQRPTLAPDETPTKPARLAAIVPSMEPLPTARPRPTPTKPLIPQGLFICGIVLLALFTLVLTLYLARWQRHLPR